MRVQPAECRVKKSGSLFMEKTILIVDDAAPVRKLLASALSKRGYSVTTAENAQTALDKLQENYFHVMFIDLHMPDMSGVELCEKIRRNYPLSFMYAMTAYVSIFALTECREAGFDDYFVKPINIELFDFAAKEAFVKIQRWSSKPGAASPASD
jgi:CheY-like chemotaxis protein